MKRFSTALVIGAIAIVMAQCTAKKATTATVPPPAAPAATAVAMTPEEAIADVKKRYTEAQMEEGNVMFRDKCGKCHIMHEPESRTVEHWEKILPRMNKKSGFNAEQGAKVRAYVLSRAKVQ